MSEHLSLLNQLQATKAAAFSPEAKSKDIELWKAWKQSRSQPDLERLLKQLEPVLAREVNRWGRSAPRFLLENEAKVLALKAFESYDPIHGTALGTHVTNHLMKLSRTAYSRQSTLSVPEAKRLSFNTVTHARSLLADQLGRQPTLDELSDHLRLPPKRLQALQAQVSKREYMESGDGPAFVQYFDDPEVVHLAWHDMTPVQKKIFEYRTGYNDTPVLKGKGILRETGLSQGQLSHQLGKIKGLLEKAQTLR